jgi:phosphoribosylaminoimidazole carboxylase (NCAIR synthetase)
MHLDKIHDNWENICMISEDIREEFIKYLENLPDEFDDYIIKLIDDTAFKNEYFSKNRYKISKSALVLGEKIYDEMGRYVFPFIEKINTKGYSGCGTWSWSMWDLKTQFSIGSSDSVNDCKLKKHGLDFVTPLYDSEYVDGEISVFLKIPEKFIK